MHLEISSQKLHKYFSNSKKKKIAIIGDVMLDKYVYGEVSRISPEAPVQVVDVKSTEYKLGGAANVANNIKALEAEPILIGVIGDDHDAQFFLETMKAQKLQTVGIFRDKSRPTTTKTRVIAHSQHVIRVDSELKHVVSKEITKKILDFVKKNLKSFDSLILQDYNKGVLSKDMIAKVIKMFKSAGKRVYVDPKFHNFFEYKSVTVFKPNRKEVQEALAMIIDGDESVKSAGEQLIDKLDCEYLVLTRGEKGMVLFDRAKNKTAVLNVPTLARKVADVSGAGDTVISTIAVMLAGGANIIEAVNLANRAAGIVCEEVGIIPIYKKALIDSLKD